LALQYQLTKQFIGSIEKLTAAFADEKDAREFMSAKIGWDHATKVDSIYRLYLHSDLIREINAKEHESVQSADSHEKSSSTTTPFSTSLKPGGLPPSKKREDIDDEDE
jgi:hypothetical protein